VPDPVDITIFVCANSARAGKMLTSGRTRPAVPDFKLPCQFQQVIIPCAGRLQPEHVLRAFEAGSRIVSVVACQEDNCHYAEGSRRCSLRIDFIKSILQEIGLGEGRLLLSHLPGSASEDMVLATGKAADANSTNVLSVQIDELRSRMIEALDANPPNPLRLSSDMPPENSLEEISVSNGSNGDE
jgi:coenzyme F420-reducing hydrogenase delta subunit